MRPDSNNPEEGGNEQPQQKDSAQQTRKGFTSLKHKYYWLNRQQLFPLHAAKEHRLDGCGGLIRHKKDSLTLKDFKSSLHKLKEKFDAKLQP